MPIRSINGDGVTASARHTCVFGSTDQKEYRPLLYFCSQRQQIYKTKQHASISLYLDLVVIVAPFSFEPFVKLLRIQSIFRDLIHPMPRHCQTGSLVLVQNGNVPQSGSLKAKSKRIRENLGVFKADHRAVEAMARWQEALRPPLLQPRNRSSNRLQAALHAATGLAKQSYLSEIHGPIASLANGLKPSWCAGVRDLCQLVAQMMGASECGGNPRAPNKKPRHISFHPILCRGSPYCPASILVIVR